MSDDDNPGILVYKGMRVGILPGDATITVGEDGSLTSRLILSTSVNILPVWLKHAAECCEKAKEVSETIANALPEDAEKQIQLLFSELQYSMLTIVSCAVAIDALYDLMKPLAKLDSDTLKGWKKKKKSRVFQISEVFRRTFKLDIQETKRCQKIVREIYLFRDRAIHPDNSIENSKTDLIFAPA